MAVEAMVRMVKRRIEYMNLLHDSLDDRQKQEMYAITVNKWKESFWAVPYSTEPEVFAPLVADIMESPLPSDLKADLAKCIHSKTQTAVYPPRPGIGESVPLPSNHDQLMLVRQSSTTSFSGQLEFEIHRFLD